MDESVKNNAAFLTGTLAAAPALSHISRGERFFTLPLETARLSGAVDTLNVVAREALLRSLELEERQRLCVVGELRTFNSRRCEGPRLIITLFARELSFTDEPDANRVELRGALCKTPTARRTPMGRDICDLMLAVNRRCGRSDYLPCICWGPLAHEASLLRVGDALTLAGRFQSRRYIKLTDDGPSDRVAYEVSVSELRREGPEEPLR